MARKEISQSQNVWNISSNLINKYGITCQAGRWEEKKNNDKIGPKYIRTVGKVMGVGKGMLWGMTALCCLKGLIIH